VLSGLSGGSKKLFKIWVLHDRFSVVAEEAIPVCVATGISIQCCPALGNTAGVRRPTAPLGLRREALHVRVSRYLVDGKLNTAPSRTPADGQRCVMVLRLV
jgi:hypothetical protein